MARPLPLAPISAPDVEFVTEYRKFTRTLAPDAKDHPLYPTDPLPKAPLPTTFPELEQDLLAHARTAPQALDVTVRFHHHLATLSIPYATTIPLSGETVNSLRRLAHDTHLPRRADPSLRDLLQHAPKARDAMLTALRYSHAHWSTVARLEETSRLARFAPGTLPDRVARMLPSTLVSASTQSPSPTRTLQRLTLSVLDAVHQSPDASPMSLLAQSWALLEKEITHLSEQYEALAATRTSYGLGADPDHFLATGTVQYLAAEGSLFAQLCARYPHTSHSDLYEKLTSSAMASWGHAAPDYLFHDIGQSLDTLTPQERTSSWWKQLFSR